MNFKKHNKFDITRYVKVFLLYRYIDMQVFLLGVGMVLGTTLLVYLLTVLSTLFYW